MFKPLSRKHRDDLVHHRRSGQVIDDLIRQIVLRSQEPDTLTQLIVFVRVRRIESEVVDIRQEIIDQLLIVGLAFLGLHDMPMLLRTELLITISGTGGSQYAEAIGQQAPDI